MESSDLYASAHQLVESLDAIAFDEETVELAKVTVKGLQALYDRLGRRHRGLLKFTFSLHPFCALFLF